MDHRSLYDDDVYAWAQQQAEALRRLAETGRNLPNELDLENVAEEIEDVGKTELHRVRSFLRLMLVHLIKAASAPQARSYPKWRSEVIVFRAELADHVTRSMRPKLSISREWRLAMVEAEGSLREEGDIILAGLGGACPLGLEDILDERLTFEAAVERITAAATQSSA